MVVVLQCARESMQREDDDRRRAASAEKSGYYARTRRPVLLAFDLVPHAASADASAGVELVQRVAVARVEHQKVVVEIAGEENAAGGRRHCGNQRRRPLLLPTHLAGSAVDR